jgi:hypothetical protein
LYAAVPHKSPKEVNIDPLNKSLQSISTITQDVLSKTLRLKEREVLCSFDAKTKKHKRKSKGWWESRAVAGNKCPRNTLLTIPTTLSNNLINSVTLSDSQLLSFDDLEAKKSAIGEVKYKQSYEISEEDPYEALFSKFHSSATYNTLKSNSATSPKAHTTPPPALSSPASGVKTTNTLLSSPANNNKHILSCVERPRPPLHLPPSYKPDLPGEYLHETITPDKAGLVKPIRRYDERAYIHLYLYIHIADISASVHIGSIDH